MAAPNILFVFTDEQRADTMSSYGNSNVNTPHLDGLAQESLLFERAYVTQSVCTPSRSTIMSGLYPHTNGCTANNYPLTKAFPTLAELWEDQDCVKGYHGKWHLGDEIFCQHGFDEWISVEDMYRPHYSEGRDKSVPSDYMQYLLAQGFKPEQESGGYPAFGRGFAASLPVEHTKPMFLAREADRFMKANRENPFMLFVNFLEPHMPFTGPYNERFPTDQVPLPENHETATEDEPRFLEVKRDHFRRCGYGGHDLSKDEGWQRICGNYWGLVELVDEAVGKILASLKAHGLDDNTIVVFTSDHGDMMGSHGLLTKTVMYEEAVKVPLMMRIPGQTPGRIAAPVSQVDLVPTLLDYADQPVESSLEGYSLRPLIESGQAEEDHVFIEWNGPNRVEHLRPDKEVSDDDKEKITRHRSRTVMSPDGWKMNLNEGDRHELYNLDDDPLEGTNLYYGGKHDDIIRALQEKLQTWQQRTNDTVTLEELLA